MKKNENVLVMSGFYLPGFKGGGPIRTIANIIDQLGNEIDFSVVTGDRDLGESAPYSGIQVGKWNEVGNARVFYLPPGIAGAWLLFRLLMRFQGEYVYINSFFSFRFSIFPVFLWRLLGRGRPILLAPRGEFSEGALAIRAKKKRFFIALGKTFGFYSKVIWHASTEYEADDIRRIMGNHCDVRTATNISRPPLELNLTKVEKSSPLRVVFVSRISEKKNLVGAIEMLCRVSGAVTFDVYGPAEDPGYWRDCEAAAKKLPAHVKFNYRGALHPVQMPDVLVNYDLFYLPTMGENFGHVIAEALGCGLPVLVSDATPWRGLVEKNIGWDIPLDQPLGFSSCIDVCCEKSAEEYAVWRKDIRTWALKNIGNTDSLEKNRRLFLGL